MRQYNEPTSVLPPFWRIANQRHALTGPAI
jgi:hypothetical protein